MDIDVYDPRLVWRCGTCDEILEDKPTLDLSITSSSVNIITSTKETQIANLNLEENSLEPCSKKMMKNYSAHNGKNDAKDFIKMENSLTIGNKNHLKKRVGSKLSVSRAKN